MGDAVTKVLTAEQAISYFLNDGDCLAIGGFVTNRRPYGLVKEIIKQKKRNLYVEGGPSGGDVDMLIGAGCVKVILVSYVANSGYTQVCRRFREAVELNSILFDDYSLDVQTIAYHGAALGLPFVPVKNMLGSDLITQWGISKEERAKHDKLPKEKFILTFDPFDPTSQICYIPTPKIDVALIHAQIASPDGTFRIQGPGFQDIDIALAAKHTIVSCEELVSNEEIRRHPELNSMTGLAVSAVVPMSYGAHPSQCFHYYDYDSQFYIDYDFASRTQENFDKFLNSHIYNLNDHAAYLDFIGASRLLALHVKAGYGYVPGLKRKQRGDQ